MWWISFWARNCQIVTDHKPIVDAFCKVRDTHTNKQARWLSFISEFTSDIWYTKGELNEAADALSRISKICSPGNLHFEELNKDQLSDAELKSIISNPDSGVQLKLITLLNTISELYCDISTGKAHPFITLKFRKQVFKNLHWVSHPGIRASLNLIWDRFIWHSMKKDCRK